MLKLKNVEDAIRYKIGATATNSVKNSPSMNQEGPTVEQKHWESIHSNEPDNLPTPRRRDDA